MTAKVRDADGKEQFAWLRVHRTLTGDPQLILVRAKCACGWYVAGDPPYVLGSASEHFRGHWELSEVAKMTLEEDTDRDDG